MAKRDRALILFTLSPRSERGRKGFGPGVVEALLDRVRSVAASVDGLDLIVASPARSAAPLDRTDRVHHLDQRGRDFGESLRFAVEDAFAAGYRQVVLIGNDAPEISKGYLEDAFALLAAPTRAAVIGPAEDGGYNLLGLNAPCREAFDSVPWGTDRVFEATVDRLILSGLVLHRLATLSDIDDAEDLRRFVRRLRSSETGVDRSLRRLARRLANLTDASIGWIPRASSSLPAVIPRAHHSRGPPL